MDFGVDGTAVYLVMELLTGRSLQEELALSAALGRESASSSGAAPRSLSVREDESSAREGAENPTVALPEPPTVGDPPKD